MHLLFDVETDGLYNNVSRIHCVAIKDLDNGETYVFNDQGNREPIVRAVTMLEEAETIIGHNIIRSSLLSRSSMDFLNHPGFWTLFFLVGFITLTFVK